MPMCSIVTPCQTMSLLLNAAASELGLEASKCTLAAWYHFPGLASPTRWIIPWSIRACRVPRL